MPHVNEEGRRGIDRATPGVGPFEIEENTAWVWRTTWGSRPWSRPLSVRERTARNQRLPPGSPEERNIFAGYHVTHEGWGAFVPLVMNHVGTVPLKMREEDPVPVAINVANSQQILMNLRVNAGVGELQWNEYQAPVDQAEAEGYVREAQAAREEGLAMATIIDPVSPFKGGGNVLVTDEAIIRAALRVDDTIWYHVGLTLTAAMTEAVMALGGNEVEPLEFQHWLKQRPPASMVESLPLDGQRPTMLAELAEQITVMANRDLRYFGLAIGRVRFEPHQIAPELIQAVQLEQVAKVNKTAAKHVAEAAQELMKAGGMSKMPTNPQIGDSWAQARAFEAALRSIDARAGVDSRPAPWVQIGNIGGSSGGSSKAPDARSGGSGAPRKRR